MVAAAPPLRGPWRIGQHGKITAAGDVLQLDAGAEDAKQRRGFSQWKVGVRAPAGRVDGDICAGVETEPSHHPADEVDVVARQYAEVVTGLVLHSGRAPARYGGPTASWGRLTVAEQLAVDHQGGRMSPVGHDHGVGGLFVLHGEAQSGSVVDAVVDSAASPGSR